MSKTLNAERGTDSQRRMVRRFWECECCGSLIACLPQDDASRYKCPQCAIVKCSHGGMYQEVTKERFFTECGLDTPNVPDQRPGE